MLKLRQNLKATLSKITSEEGHSLLSTALAIVGLGLLLTVGFTVVGIYDKQTKLIQSDDNIKIVREAITEYSEIHGRIPCPASMTADVNTAEFGVSVGGAAGCETGAFSGVERVTGEKGSAVLIGSIPTRTLNLGDDAALDGYEGKFFFAVTGSFTSPSANMSPSDGDISILDEHGNSVTSSNSGVVYAIVASGANQNGAFSQNGQQIEPCNTASFAGENCDFDDATFNVSMNKSFGTGDDSFTNDIFYMASNDVYQWKVGYGECTCPTKTRPAVVECYKIPGGFGGTDDGGGNTGGDAPLPVLVNDSFCPTPKPTPAPQDCSAEPQVNNCFGWYTPTFGTCPCDTTISRTSTCNERSGNDGSLVIANVSNELQCSREGDAEPQPNPEAKYCGDCPTSGVCGTTKDSCITGSLQNATETATAFTWECSGTGGGTTSSCSTPKTCEEQGNCPTNGQCSTTLNQCSNGSAANITETDTAFTWTCEGTNGGTNDSCSEPKGCQGTCPTNGLCGSATNQCSSGDIANIVETATAFTWSCEGVNGGTSEQCNTPKVLDCDGICGTDIGQCVRGLPTNLTGGAAFGRAQWTCTATHSSGQASQCTWTGMDPLALDLNGDGVIDFKAVNEGTLFDVNNDGEADNSSWISEQDGLLAFDRNGNGTIDGQNELFGNAEKMAFEHLAEHDSNNNGIIDHEDDDYNDIIVWQDSNSDGVSQSSEMKSLADWNIVGVNLGHEDVNQTQATNQITGRGTFTRVLDTGEEVVDTVVEFFLNMFNKNDDNS
jgi:hypothetical protein